MTWLEASARWYALLVVVTWAWAPLVRLLCPRLSDRGATIARPLAILGSVYPGWLLASLGVFPYSTTLLWATIAVAGIGGWVVIAWRRMADRRWLASLLIAELVSLAAFALYVWLRGFTPDLTLTEKPMDAAFLASSARTTVMPPPDPWFAGQPINYYYLGYLLHGSLSRLAGVPATTGFNLALATTFAATLTAAAGLGYDAARPWFSARWAVLTGALGAILLVVVGNLYAALRVLQTPAETINASWWDTEVGIGWRASRIVCDTARINNGCPFPYETINEFPDFSFLLGDLHPHLMALPFTVVALSLALNLVLRANGNARPSPAEWGRLVATGAIIGALYALNSWDFPTFLLVAMVATWWAFGRRLATCAGPILALVVSSVVAWLPFVLRFVPPTGGDVTALPAFVQQLPVLPRLLTTIGPHVGDRTSTGEFLTMFGIPYLLSLGLIGTGWLRAAPARTGPVVSPGSVIFWVVVIAAAILLPAPLLVLCGLPLAAALVCLARTHELSARAIATALFALGYALLLAVEFLYIRDAFDSRMNTLFKVYYQVWTLFAVAAALSVAVLWRELTPGRLARPALAAGTAALVVAGAVYPAVAWYQWTDHFGDWQGLDGIAYAKQTAPDEAAAIAWLEANATPDDVLLEAAGCSYTPNVPGELPLDRASAYSGVPTVIGWGNHERQWRSGQPALMAEIGSRPAEVTSLFADPHGALLDRFGVTLLYVGRYETGDWQPGCDVAGPYPAVDEPSFPGAGWTLAFSDGDVRIYRRQT